VTPGYLGEDQSEARLKAEADRIGYPVLIKAVAGGGGKGMRKVERGGEFAAALQSARREAKAAFGDDRVLLETYVSRPRHIEVQVFGDGQGRVVHLFERDCSLQRRHQKVIEEAPAPGMPTEVRAAVCAAAVKAAEAVGYVGAGTVEFIADGSEGLRADRVWFMEMNTRLQVEHPVTEAVTGVDLVEWQLRAASGEPLPLAQDEIRLSGCAIEARLYAEAPGAGFLPSTGPLTHFRLPGQVRVDGGVEQGGVITPFYDPMIAKLIAHAPGRTAAAAALEGACAEVEVWPVKTNAGFLARCLGHPDFVAGAVDTGFIEARLEALLPPSEPSSEVLNAAAGASLAEAAAGERSPWTGLTGFRLNAAPVRRGVLSFEGRAIAVDLGEDAGSGLTVAREGSRLVVFEAGQAFAFGGAEGGAAGDAGGGDGVIRSPMPGRIVAVQVKAGQVVARGEPLVTLEAMKMEHVLTAPFDGTVAELAAETGSQVSEGAILARLDKPA
jgi:acetyl/propionyl-CoA carboxylase alpha subunit